MIARQFLSALLLVLLISPNGIDAQSIKGLPAAYRGGGDGSHFTGNVPLNEINIHAYRHFRRRWPAVNDEAWLKEKDGYVVSFRENSFHCQARFDARGGFLYSLKYFSGIQISTELNGLIKKKFPEYEISVVTEISNGDKFFYLAKIESPSSVKTISVNDGQVEVLDELVNGQFRSTY